MNGTLFWAYALLEGLNVGGGGIHLSVKFSYFVSQNTLLSEKKIDNVGPCRWSVTIFPVGSK